MNFLTPRAAEVHEKDPLRKAMQSGDILSLEEAIRASEGLYNHRPDHTVVAAKQLLHTWTQRTHRELDRLRAAVHSRKSKEIIAAIHMAQSSPHSSSMRSDIKKAKSLLKIQENAMREVGVVVESCDVIALSEFLKSYKECLPDDVVKELTDLRRQFVKNAASVSGPSKEERFNPFHFISASPQHGRSPITPHTNSPAARYRHHHDSEGELGPAPPCSVSPIQVAYPPRDSPPQGGPTRLTSPPPSSNNVTQSSIFSTIAPSFEEEIYYLENAERCRRCDIILLERNERIGIVKLMMHDLNRVRELLNHPDHTSTTLYDLYVLFSREGMFRQEILQGEFVDRSNLERRFKDIADNCLDVGQIRIMSHVAFTTPIVSPSRTVQEAEQLIALSHEMQRQQKQYIDSMQASQLCITYERQRAERAEVVAMEISERFQLFAAHHLALRHHVVPALQIPMSAREESVEDSLSTRDSQQNSLHQYEATERLVLESAGEEVLNNLGTLLVACLTRGGIEALEGMERDRFEQLSLAVLWDLYNERT